MPKFETLFSKYDRLVLFDTETTGLAYNRDEIIEFAAVVLERVDGTPKVVQEYDQLVAVPRRVCAAENSGADRHLHPRPAGAGTAQDQSLPGHCRNDSGQHPAAGLQRPF